MNGWRDSFNFADLVLREIENAEYIAGHRLVKEQGIKYGLFTEEDVYKRQVVGGKRCPVRGYGGLRRTRKAVPKADI